MVAKLVQEGWDCSDNKMIQKRAHSGGKEDGVEACKILGQKDKVDKSRKTRDLQVPWSWYYSRGPLVVKLIAIKYYKRLLCYLSS